MRDERTVQTRERILDALVQVLARNGIAELSIPLVAREAKVSIPSVYRYFPTKRDLFAALDDYAHSKGGFSFSDFPNSDTPEELAAIIPSLFQRRESIEPTIAAALRTRIGYDIRPGAAVPVIDFPHLELPPPPDLLGRYVPHLDQR